MWNIGSAKVIPVVAEALGSISKKLMSFTEELGVIVSTTLLQKASLLGAALILRKGLNCRYGLWKQGWG